MSKKLVLVFCICMLCFSLLYLRIGTLVMDDNLIETGLKQSTYSLKFGETRGLIYDCRMIPLVEEETEYLAAIAPVPENILHLKENMVLEHTDNLEELIHTGQPFLLKSKLPNVNIPNVEVFSLAKRYCKKQLAQHVIGYIDSSANKGRTGIEFALDEVLSAHSQFSKISYQRDGMGKLLNGSNPQISLADLRTDGVVLTLDSRIQTICEEVGQRKIKKGAIVVLEPSTGKLKAVASFPSYQADNIASAMKDTKNTPLLNRAYQAYSVGSTFKLVTAATALEQGILPNTSFACSGEYTLEDVTFGCHEKNGHGTIDMKTALAVSCNPYFIQLSQQLDKQIFLNYASDLSFGKATELAPNLKTASGKIPDISSLINPGAVANLSFGQGQLTATPIQVAQMLATIVNDGELYFAHLLEGYTQDGKVIETHEEQAYPMRVMNKNTAQLLKAYLTSAVMDTIGQNAKPAYTTAGGKTGTAQTGQYKEDKKELLHGWFAGFFPTDKPQYVIVVMIEDAQSGNQDASPVFREIADAMTAPRKLPPEMRN